MNQSTKNGSHHKSFYTQHSKIVLNVKPVSTMVTHISSNVLVGWVILDTFTEQVLLRYSEKASFAQVHSITES